MYKFLYILNFTDYGAHNNILSYKIYYSFVVNEIANFSEL